MCPVIALGEVCNNNLEETILAIDSGFESSGDTDDLWYLEFVADAAACRELCINTDGCYGFIFVDAGTCYARTENYLKEFTGISGYTSGYLSNCHGAFLF